MTAILLVSHGGLAQAMLETAEMILGPQEYAAAIGLLPEETPQTLEMKITSRLDAFSGMPVLVLTDICSGTPFNTVTRLSERYAFCHVTGVSLPLLSEALMDRDSESPDALARKLKEIAPETVLNVTQMQRDMPEEWEQEDF